MSSEVNECTEHAGTTIASPRGNTITVQLTRLRLVSKRKIANQSEANYLEVTIRRTFIDRETSVR